MELDAGIDPEVAEFLTRLLSTGITFIVVVVLVIVVMLILSRRRKKKEAEADHKRS